MRTNIYWPVYKNLEEEFSKLMFYIHIDDNQLNVYSSKISDLILRAATEIESLSKEMYKSNGGTKENARYDLDALSHLDNLWRISEKEVIISSYKCFVSERTIKPFVLSETKTGTTRLTYTWNNAYQNLKHDRANSLKFGSIKYLIDVIAALFLLNIYYKENSFDLHDNSTGTNFDGNLGSEIFSVKLHVNNSISTDINYPKNKDYYECVYLLKPTDKTRIKVQEAFNEMNKAVAERTKAEIPQLLKDEFERLGSAEMVAKTIKDVIDKRNLENMKSVGREYGKSISDAFKSLRYEAVINKNQFPDI